MPTLVSEENTTFVAPPNLFRVVEEDDEFYSVPFPSHVLHAALEFLQGKCGTTDPVIAYQVLRMFHYLDADLDNLVVYKAFAAATNTVIDTEGSTCDILTDD